VDHSVASGFYETDLNTKGQSSSWERTIRKVVIFTCSFFFAGKSSLVLGTNRL
jgi:hypothetical protein